MTSRAREEYRYEKLTWPEINDAVDLGKDTLAEAFERKRMQAPQHSPIRFRNLPHRVSVH